MTQQLIIKIEKNKVVYKTDKLEYQYLFKYQK